MDKLATVVGVTIGPKVRDCVLALAWGAVGFAIAHGMRRALETEGRTQQLSWNAEDQSWLCHRTVANARGRPRGACLCSTSKGRSMAVNNSSRC